MRTDDGVLDHERLRKRAVPSVWPRQRPHSVA
jgi:hypothetical protein